MKRGAPMRRTRLKVKGRARFKGRDNPAYRAWLIAHGCIICGRPAECCHVKTRATGGYTVGNTWPGCREHHRQSHDMGIRSFEQRYGQDLAAIAARFGAYWLERHPDDSPSACPQDAPDAP